MIDFDDVGSGSGRLAGKFEIPREIWDALGKICHAHGRALLDLAARLGVQD